MKRRVANTKLDATMDDSAMMVSSSTSPSKRGVTTNNASSSSSSSSTSTKVIITILLITIGSLLGYIIHQKEQFNIQSTKLLSDRVQSMNTELEQVKQTQLTKLKTSYETKITTLTNKQNTLSKQLEEATKASNEIQKKFVNDSGSDSERIEKLQHELDLFKKALDHLQKEIQRHDKQSALEEFGEGPHRVEIVIDFPPEEIPDGDTDRFVIEMAPLDLMPHTVRFFLQQVKKGLLDGCSFHRNAGHVVQGGPVSNHLSKGVNVQKPFHDADLSSVSFQEYHADFPHKKYTLGYAGRPGGPDFYVSTVDNTMNHGPGGQSSYAMASEADPCFAKVIDGFEAVDRMHKMSVKPGGYKRMNHYVAIKSAKIVKSEL